MFELGRGTGVAAHCSFPADEVKWTGDRLPPFRAGQTDHHPSPVLRAGRPGSQADPPHNQTGCRSRLRTRCKRRELLPPRRRAQPDASLPQDRSSSENLWASSFWHWWWPLTPGAARAHSVRQASPRPTPTCQLSSLHDGPPRTLWMRWSTVTFRGSGPSLGRQPSGSGRPSPPEPACWRPSSAEQRGSRPSPLVTLKAGRFGPARSHPTK